MKELKTLKPYLAKCKGHIIFALIFAFISISAKLFIPLLAGKAVNYLSTLGSGEVNFTYLGHYILIMTICLVLGTVFRYFFDYFTSYVGQVITKDLRDEVYKSYLHTSVSYLDKNEKGNLLLRLVNDVENVQNGLVSGGAALFDGVVAILITIIFMFTVNWALALLVVGLTPLSMFVSKFVSKWNSKYFKEQAASAGKISAFGLESLNNSEAVSTLNLKEARKEKFVDLNENFRKSVFKASLGASLINPSTRLVNNLINAAVITVGAIFIVKDVNLGVAFLVGDLSSFLVYASNYMAPFNEISDVVSEISFALASFRRIDNAIHAEKDVNAGTGVINEDFQTVNASHVDFSYDPSRKIIDDFSIHVEKGQKVALVGPTGCGKTTIINLIMRFYDPQVGHFSVNDVSTIDLEKSAFRKHLGMVLQDTWIFAGTVYENIAYAKPGASLEEVKEAAKKAQADDFIERLPKGYDTFITDSSGLSLGEKQLLCVARVMLLSPEVVILDEATSNIDIRTESLLSKSFDELMKGKTSFVVAHRLSTIVKSDIILVMKDGKIIEQGNHQSLLDKKGFYYELYHSQFNS